MLTHSMLQQPGSTRPRHCSAANRSHTVAACSAATAAAAAVADTDAVRREEMLVLDAGSAKN